MPHHWIAALWHRSTPSVVAVLDSMVVSVRGTKSVRAATNGYDEALRHFVALCTSLCDAPAAMQLALVPTAQQQDGSSCGLFVIEFGKLLCEDADERAGLLQVDTSATRAWLGTLSRTLDEPMRDPLFQRSGTKRARDDVLDKSVREPVSVD